MMTATECPTAERLKAYSLGRLPEAENDELFEHLRSCTTCQAELETVDDADDSLIGELRATDQFASLAEEPDCKLAMVKALGALAAADELSATGLHNVPRVIGEYEIVRLLGRGGMGKVFLARHSKLGRHVAVKLLSGHRLADQRTRDRFDSEMRAIGQLSHPNIVTAHDAREVDGTAVLVTEYIDGLDLGELVAKNGPVSTADACEIIRKVAVALQYTSDQGFVHRDVKPSNIMISRDGEVKLLDLGLARYQSGPENELTAAGQAIGTADYVSPEQVTDGREVDCRSDIYSLGCTLFKLLSGNAPFADQTHQTVFAKMTAQVSETPPSLADRVQDCPPGLVRLVDSMLAKDPSRRPQLPSDVAATLATWSAGHDLVHLVEIASACDARTRPLPLSATTQTKPWYQRSVPITMAIGLGLLGVLLGLLMGLFIKITFPDGTVFEAPLDGAQIEVVKELDDDTGDAKAADVVRPAAEEKLAQRAATRHNDVLEKLSGIWLLVGYKQPNSVLPEGMLLAIDQTEFYAVTKQNPQAGFQVSAGQFTTFQQDHRGLNLLAVDEVTGNQISVGCQFPDESSMVFQFDPFLDTAEMPFQGRLRNHGKGHLYRFKKLGAFSEINQIPPSGPDSDDAKALAMIRQLKTLGVDRYLKQHGDPTSAPVRQQRSVNNLKQIGLAFHNFHAAYRKFPGSVNLREGSLGAGSRKIQPFSWRVAILPFIEGNALFEQYKFDEPWDSESNLKLLDQMPEVYRSPHAPEDQPSGHTNYLGYATGNSAIGTEGGVGMRELRDGNSNTLLLVETKHSVPWTKPEDLTGEEDAEFFEPVTYLMADGSVRTTEKLDPELLKKLITRDGGEVIPR
ncbi:protein kinase [Stieleria sp. ICT_E10.1]|uniref:protein kinase domain-containing protein n=1 Tax=Stieleria sedimenti TaxID=2976331 RepID=UPI0021806112|nr:protein kinase [Stieleria sedimenti]MCS7470483.1 protein kinase [Stieleria sedimenti]